MNHEVVYFLIHDSLFLIYDLIPPGSSLPAIPFFVPDPLSLHPSCPRIADPFPMTRYFHILAAAPGPFGSDPDRIGIRRRTIGSDRYADTETIFLLYILCIGSHEGNS